MLSKYCLSLNGPSPHSPDHHLSSLSPRCVAIDFGSSRVRYPDETDEEWRRAKQNQDEEGAVGQVLQGLVKKCAEDCNGSLGEFDQTFW